MTNELYTSRYGTPTCNLGWDEGFTVSTPIYITLTTDLGKAYLNRFREIKSEQLKEMGWTDTQASTGSSIIKVRDTTPPPMSPLEQALGMDEATLRGLLLGRHGIAERTLFKLQELVGELLVTREHVLTTVNKWLDANINDEKPKPKTRKTTATRTQRTADS